jgi:surfactin synthase thioesterase subunit
MTNYIIGISGSGGGDSGPNNLYQLLKLKFTNRVILYDTIPNDEKYNINNIINIINNILINENDATFTLLGYSMGGTIALMVGIYFTNKKCITKIIFLSSQTAGFDQLNYLKCPIVIFHSINDLIIPIKYIYKWIELYTGNIKTYLLTCDHNWSNVNMITIINKLNL